MVKELTQEEQEYKIRKQAGLQALVTQTPAERNATAQRLHENTPAELQTLKQWTCYKLEPKDDGKLDKVPYIANSRKHKASTADDSTWAYFTDAVEAFQNPDNGFVGVSFMFSDKCTYTGIDLDVCVDAKGNLTPTAAAQIAAFDGGYVEMSASGTGVHCFVKGKLPAGRRRNDVVEMYDRVRFFTFTGLPVAGIAQVKEIPDRQAQLSAFHSQVFAANAPKPTKQAKQTTASTLAGHRNGATAMGDAELLEKMFNAVNGEAIRRLYNGDPSGYPSKSEADFALCSHLAFWTRNDPEQMDSMLQASGLYRDKLKRKDYRKRTIDNVIKGGGNTYQSAPKHGTEIDLTPPSVDAPVIPVYTRKQFNDLPPLEWLVEGLFAEKDYVMVYGPSGAGKTFVMLDLAAACVAGEPVAGIFPVKRPMSVWYCSREGVGGMGARLNSACEKYNLPDDAALYYTPITPQLFKNEVTNPQAAKWFIKRWQEMGSGPLDLLIIDTYWTATDGMDENSASDARVVARTLDDIKCELGCVVMLSHHANKGGMIERGSGALRAIMDCIMRVDATDSTHTLACEKQKEGEEWEPLDFTLQTDIEDLSGCTVQWGAQSKAPTPGTQAQILELLQSDLKLWGPAAISTKLKTVGTRQNVSDQLVKLAKDNKVVCEGKPAKYRAVQ